MTLPDIDDLFHFLHFNDIHPNVDKYIPTKLWRFAVRQLTTVLPKQGHGIITEKDEDGRLKTIWPVWTERWADEDWDGSAEPPVEVVSAEGSEALDLIISDEYSLR